MYKIFFIKRIYEDVLSSGDNSIVKHTGQPGTPEPGAAAGN